MKNAADFYILNDKYPKWLGSILSNGCPEFVDFKILEATSQREFIFYLNIFLSKRDDSIFTHDGHPSTFSNYEPTFIYTFNQEEVVCNYLKNETFSPIQYINDHDQIYSDLWQKNRPSP